MKLEKCTCRIGFFVTTPFFFASAGAEAAVVFAVPLAIASGAAVTGCGAAIPGLDGTLATGGLVVAHALVKRRSGAMARTTAGERAACEIVFMVLISEIV